MMGVWRRGLASNRSIATTQSGKKTFGPAKTENAIDQVRPNAVNPLPPFILVASDATTF